MSEALNVGVRPGVTSDAERLAEFAARVFWQSYQGQMAAHDLRAYITEHFGLEQQTRELNDESATSFFAEIGDRLIGYAQVKTGSQPSCPLDGPAAELHRIYVESSSRSSGVGTRLLQSCAEHARERGANWLWLSVWKQNARAIAFYQRHGLRIIGAQPFRVGSDLQEDHVMAIDVVAELVKSRNAPC